MRHWFVSAISLWRCVFPLSETICPIYCHHCTPKKTWHYLFSFLFSYNLKFEAFLWCFLLTIFEHPSLANVNLVNLKSTLDPNHCAWESVWTRVCVCVLNFMLDNTNYRSSWFYDNRIVQMFHFFWIWFDYTFKLNGDYSARPIFSSQLSDYHLKVFYINTIQIN